MTFGKINKYVLEKIIKERRLKKKKGKENISI